MGHIFKFFHLPGSSIILGFGYLTSVLGFAAMGIRAKNDLKDSLYLKRLSFSINAVLILVFLGVFFKTLRLPGGQFLITIGSILYVISILALVFTLPNSNFHNWATFYKKYFFRTIIIPMAYIFLFLTIYYTFPKSFDNLTGQNNLINWGMTEYQLEQKEGLD
jgi:hypothetical protein